MSENFQNRTFNAVRLLFWSNISVLLPGVSLTVCWDATLQSVTQIRALRVAVGGGWVVVTKWDRGDGGQRKGGGWNNYCLEQTLWFRGGGDKGPLRPPPPTLLAPVLWRGGGHLPPIPSTHVWVTAGLRRVKKSAGWGAGEWTMYYGKLIHNFPNLHPSLCLVTGPVGPTRGRCGHFSHMGQRHGEWG